jgi:IS1 family transposase
MNSAALLQKEIKILDLGSDGSTVGNVLGFVCGSRTIKTLRRLFKQLKGLPTMDYGKDFLKTYENLIPTTLPHQRGGIHYSDRVTQLSFQTLLSQLHRSNLCYSRSKEC